MWSRYAGKSTTVTLRAGLTVPRRLSSLGSLTCNGFLSNTSTQCFSLASGAVGRFSGGPEADILLWSYNGQGASALWNSRGESGAPYRLSAPDVDGH